MPGTAAGQSSPRPLRPYVVASGADCPTNTQIDDAKSSCRKQAPGPACFRRSEVPTEPSGYPGGVHARPETDDPEARGRLSACSPTCRKAGAPGFRRCRLRLAASAAWPWNCNVVDHVPCHSQDPIQQHCRDRSSRDGEMKTSRGDDHAKDILNPGGATLAQVAGESTPTRWIVLCMEAFHEDESPQMSGCARNLAPTPFSAEMHPPARFRPAMAPSFRRPVRAAPCAPATQVFTAEFDNAVF